MEATADGDTVTLYPSRYRRPKSRRVRATGLELQIDLDTSAGAYQRSMERRSDWSAPIDLLGRPLTPAHVPTALARRSGRAPPRPRLRLRRRPAPRAPARWLLQWVLRWHGWHARPAGRAPGRSRPAWWRTWRSGDQPRRSRARTRCLGWLIGRAPADDLRGGGHSRATPAIIEPHGDRQRRSRAAKTSCPRPRAMDNNAYLLTASATTRC